MRHLVIRLEAPLMSLGGESVDNIGVTRWFPQASTLTGLVGNALGWRRTDGGLHHDLQGRMVFAARIDREPPGGHLLRDFQTAALGAKDVGWTTRGVPEGRRSGQDTLKVPHLRFRDYLADASISVAMRLNPSRVTPTLNQVAEALDRPARPLFIGRKHCLPTRRLADGFVEGATVLDALMAVPLEEDDDDTQPDRVRFLWPAGEGSIDHAREYVLNDLRNWTAGLHGGGRDVCEGSVLRTELPRQAEATEED